jgi:hypothetical protein
VITQVQQALAESVADGHAPQQIKHKIMVDTPERGPYEIYLEDLEARIAEVTQTDAFSIK